jgi:ABC-type phosphate transport system substrate-binding protein
MPRSGPITHRTALAIALSSIALTIGLASTSIASGTHYKVIIHPANHDVRLARSFVRDAFLKKATEWHGQTIRPIDLASMAATREQFTRDVIRKTPAQLKRYWNQQIFSGKGVPPPEAGTPAEVVAYVLANPGAIGYLPADADPGAAKVVEVWE